MIIPSINKNVEKEKLSFSAGGDVKWYNHFRKQFGNFFKKLSIHLASDPAISLLGIYPREMKACVHTKT